MTTLLHHTLKTRFQQWLGQQQCGTGILPVDQPETPQAQASLPRGTPSQIRWRKGIKNDVALNGAFATDDPAAYLDAWQSVDSDEGVPLKMGSKNGVRGEWHVVKR